MKKTELQKLLEYRDFLKSIQPDVPVEGAPVPTSEDMRQLRRYDAVKAYKPSPAEASFQTFEAAGAVS